MHTCCISDTNFINEKGIKTIELLIYDLTYFGDGFSNMFCNSSFIQKMQDEIPYLNKLTNTRAFDLNNMEVKTLQKSKITKETTKKQQQI